MDELLSELRGLRAELRQAASASISAQVLMGRLALQEHRITAAARQLADVQTQVANHAQARGRFEQQLKALEVERGMPEQQRNEILPAVKAELERHQQRERELREQEASLQALMNAEQSRWSDFNSRLDELERALARR
jgi:chromosome segregation ATPase